MPLEPNDSPEPVAEKNVRLSTAGGLYRHPEAFGTQGIELLPMKGFKLEERSIVVRLWAVRARVVRGETFNMMVIMTFQI